MACWRPTCCWLAGCLLGRFVRRRRVRRIRVEGQGHWVGGSRAGPVVALADMDVAETQKELGDIGCDSGSSTVSSPSSEPGGSPPSAGGDIAAHDPAAAREPVSAKFTPGSQPPVGVGGKRTRRARAPIQSPGVGTAGGCELGALRSKRQIVVMGGSLIVLRRHEPGAAVGLGPPKAPRPTPSDGILMGFQAVLPAKRLRVRKVSVRARA